MDAIGNVVATRAGSDPTAAAVMVGSHIDTVRTGGRFDGNLGVLAGLEIVETPRSARRHHTPSRSRSRSSPTRKGPGSRPTCSAARSTSARLPSRRRSTCWPPTTAPDWATSSPHRLRRAHTGSGGLVPALLRRAAHRAGPGARTRGHHHRSRHRGAGHLVDRGHDHRAVGPRRHHAHAPAPRPDGRCRPSDSRAPFGRRVPRRSTGGDRRQPHRGAEPRQRHPIERGVHHRSAQHRTKQSWRGSRRRCSRRVGHTRPTRAARSRCARWPDSSRSSSTRA